MARRKKSIRDLADQFIRIEDAVGDFNNPRVNKAKQTFLRYRENILNTKQMRRLQDSDKYEDYERAYTKKVPRNVYMGLASSNG